jgi:hypothetical protein
VPICIRFEGKNIEGVEQLIYACGQDRRTALGCAITEFGGDNDAGGERVAFYGREGGDPGGDLALRILEEVGQDVGVEEVLSGH